MKITIELTIEQIRSFNKLVRYDLIDINTEYELNEDERRVLEIYESTKDLT